MLLLCHSETTANKPMHPHSGLVISPFVPPCFLFGQQENVLLAAADLLVRAPDSFQYGLHPFFVSSFTRMSFLLWLIPRQIHGCVRGASLSGWRLGHLAVQIGFQWSQKQWPVVWISKPKKFGNYFSYQVMKASSWSWIWPIFQFGSIRMSFSEGFIGLNHPRLQWTKSCGQVDWITSSCMA